VITKKRVRRLGFVIPECVADGQAKEKFL